MVVQDKLGTELANANDELAESSESLARLSETNGELHQALAGVRTLAFVVVAALQVGAPNPIVSQDGAVRRAVEPCHSVVSQSRWLLLLGCNLQMAERKCSDSSSSFGLDASQARVDDLLQQAAETMSSPSTCNRYRLHLTQLLHSTLLAAWHDLTAA